MYLGHDRSLGCGRGGQRDRRDRGGLPPPTRATCRRCGLQARLTHTHPGRHPAPDIAAQRLPDRPRLRAATRPMLVTLHGPPCDEPPRGRSNQKHRSC